MGRPSKALISRSATLKAALKIIDEEGLERLSIRRLGAALNVQGISLYHHFKDKDEILAAVCELALANVRTPNTTDVDWREWLLNNALKFRQTLRSHPNLVPVMMRRHPLRIGLKEHNATAGLLAVQGVPREAIMPLLETLEELALGSASYESAVHKDEYTESWKEFYPNLYHLSLKPALTRDEIFELVARATIEAIMRGLESRANARPASIEATPPPAKAQRQAKTLAKRAG